MLTLRLHLAYPYEDHQNCRPNGQPVAVILATTVVVRIGFSLTKCTAEHRMKGIAMKKLTRILTMGGFGLLAALATGAGPANAATPSATPESKTVVKQVQWRSGVDVVGYYRNLQECELAGQFGERTGHWDDHNCTIVRLGVRSGAWALQVASGDDWDRGGFGVPFRAIGGFPIQFRPVWAGAFRGNNHGPIRGNNHGGGNHGGNNHGGNNHGGGDHGHGGGNHGHGHGH
jgi:hypothetical protein